MAESDSRYWLMRWSSRSLRLVADSAIIGGILPAQLIKGALDKSESNAVKHQRTLILYMYVSIVFGHFSLFEMLMKT